MHHMNKIKTNETNENTSGKLELDFGAKYVINWSCHFSFRCVGSPGKYYFDSSKLVTLLSSPNTDIAVAKLHHAVCCDSLRK